MIYKITDINLLNIIRTTYLTNITSKIYEYYYYKSDRYFINYLDLKIHNERRKNINLLNLIINMFLIIICIIKKKYDLVLLVIILSNIITLTYININIFLKPFINNKRKVIYHIINNIISIMILLIENIKMNITNVYSISIISYLINYIIMKKYICKVKTS